jgi:uncharacterized protein (DUF427 family)
MAPERYMEIAKINVLSQSDVHAHICEGRFNVHLYIPCSDVKKLQLLHSNGSQWLSGIALNA